MAFARALKSLDELFGSALPKGQSLLDFEEILYRGTFGCFGLACNWVLLAFAAKVATGSRHLLECHFLNTRLQLQLEESAAEIAAGEARMETLCKRHMEETHQLLESKMSGKEDIVVKKESVRKRKSFGSNPRRFSTKSPVHL